MPIERTERLQGLPAAFLSLVLLVVVAALDTATGPHLALAFLYVVPVALSAWTLGLSGGLAVAIVASVIFYLVDTWLDPPGYPNSTVVYWNTGIRSGFFLLAAVLVDRLRQARLAERQMADLRVQMVSLVSHELRNALSAMQMSLALLRRGEQVTPEHRERALDALDRLVAHVRQTSRTFLDRARLDSGRFALRPRRVLVREVVEESLDLLRVLAEHKQLEVRRDFPSKLVPVIADPDALILVMTNLLDNAIKYTPEGGRLTVGIAPEGSPTQAVCVFVEDTGIGIAPEDQARVLRGHRTEEGREVAKGHGIGLVTARELVESHGSHLVLESRPGAGSRFAFVLPVVGASEDEDLPDCTQDRNARAPDPR